MQTSGKKPAARSTPSRLTTSEMQLERFKEMAKEVGADESAGALDRAFARLDAKNKAEVPSRKPVTKKSARHKPKST
jgi:hypothetical protein